METEFNISCSENNLKLPKLFWIPKLHKNPCEFCFIAGARSCTTKQLLSVILIDALSVIKENFAVIVTLLEEIPVSICSGVSIGFKSDPVHSLQVYDFATLYTYLNQQDILGHLFEVFDIVFYSFSRKYICIGWHKTFC